MVARIRFWSAKKRARFRSAVFLTGQSYDYPTSLPNSKKIPRSEDFKKDLESSAGVVCRIQFWSTKSAKTISIFRLLYTARLGLPYIHSQSGQTAQESLRPQGASRPEGASGPSKLEGAYCPRCPPQTITSQGASRPEGASTTTGPRRPPCPRKPPQQPARGGR